MDTPYFRGIPIAAEARGTINKEKTYKIVNGLQVTMNYYTPTNPQTEAQQANRVKFAEGMAAALALTEEQREPYKTRARTEGRVTWFNIFIRDHMATA